MATPIVLKVTVILYAGIMKLAVIIARMAARIECLATKAAALAKNQTNILFFII